MRSDLAFFYAFMPFLAAILMTIAACNSSESGGMQVHFPKVTGPIQITSDDKEHLYASYYGITSFDASQRYAVVLQTDIRYRLPEVNEPALMGLVDLETHEFIPLAETRAWNFQQGNMAHWLAASPDSLIIYNDFREGKNVSVIMNVHTLEEIRVIPYPVSAVSPNGREAISINFSRLLEARPDYGYPGGGQDPGLDEALPMNDGLFIIDLETGNATLLVSYYDVKDALYFPLDDGDIAWFNHTYFSRDGSKIFWLARQTNGWRRTTSLLVNRDGTGLQRAFPEGWGGSHSEWLDGDRLMVTARYRSQQWAHILFTAGEQDYYRLGNGLIDGFDGHGTFSPDQRWMVTDTYSSRDDLREQKIFLMDMETEAAISLGRYHQPAEYRSYWDCDIHPRWSPNGDMIGFNSTHSGRRQAYLFRLEF